MSVPAQVMTRARRSLLDYLAVTCAGAAFQKEKLKGYCDFAQPEEGKFKVIGTGSRLEQMTQNMAAAEKGELPQPVLDAMDAAWEIAKPDSPAYFKFI